MVDLNLSQSPERPPIDTVLTELAPQIGDGKPYKIRVQPQVYNYDAQRHEGWPALVWQMEAKDLDAASRFRIALTKYFALLGEIGSEKMIELLVAGTPQTQAEAPSITQ